MSTNAGNVTMVVIEMGPGLVYVKIADPKPVPERIEFFLRRAIDDWFGLHPALVVDRTEAIMDDGGMLGIHVWYHTADERPGPASPAAYSLGDFRVDVHDQITRQHPNEYVEAVVDDVMKVLPSFEHRQDTLVVINRRRVAVILDKQSHRAIVIPAAFVEQAIDGPMNTKLQAWLSAPSTRFYVMHIPGSWLAR